MVFFAVKLRVGAFGLKFLCIFPHRTKTRRAPRRSLWIEIYLLLPYKILLTVGLRVGACELKFYGLPALFHGSGRAPRRSLWIEMISGSGNLSTT